MLMSRIGEKMILRVIELSRTEPPDPLRRAAQAQPGACRHSHRCAPATRIEVLSPNLCDFGAFVDLGGLEGLIHISELSWGRSSSAEILERGTQVKAYVLEVNRDAGRIALSLKRLHSRSWETFSRLPDRPKWSRASSPTWSILARLPVSKMASKGDSRLGTGGGAFPAPA